MGDWLQTLQFLGRENYLHHRVLRVCCFQTKPAANKVQIIIASLQVPGTPKQVQTIHQLYPNITSRILGKNKLSYENPVAEPINLSSLTTWMSIIPQDHHDHPILESIILNLHMVPIFFAWTAVYALRHGPVSFESYSRTSGESNHHRYSLSATSRTPRYQLSHEDDYSIYIWFLKYRYPPNHSIHEWPWLSALKPTKQVTTGSRQGPGSPRSSLSRWLRPPHATSPDRWDQGHHPRNPRSSSRTPRWTSGHATRPTRTSLTGDRSHPGCNLCFLKVLITSKRWRNLKSQCLRLEYSMKWQRNDQ